MAKPWLQGAWLPAQGSGLSGLEGGLWCFCSNPVGSNRETDFCVELTGTAPHPACGACPEMLLPARYLAASRSLNAGIFLEPAHFLISWLYISCVLGRLLCFSRYLK